MAFPCRRFSFAEIRTATDYFSDSLGDGGFGIVYRGRIVENDDKEVPIAVKRLKEKTWQNATDFVKEIEMLSQCRYRHVVTLLGWCDERGEMILVYELMSRGSLYTWLFEEKRSLHVLTMKQRLEILIGAAKGLEYLHSGTSFNIIHSDVKSDNILLDENWVAKIADFGLSRARPIDQLSSQQVSLSVKGTRGYIAPEFYNSIIIPSRKADVYSLGVVILEVLCEKKAWDNLAASALPFLKNGRFLEITAPHVAKNISPDCLKTCVSIVRRCLKREPRNRPSMFGVASALEEAMEQQEASNPSRSAVEDFRRTSWPLPTISEKPDTTTASDQSQSGSGSGSGSTVAPKPADKAASPSVGAVPKAASGDKTETPPVVYYTSSTVVRRTFNEGREVRKILEGYGKRVDERDLYLDPAYVKQIEGLLGKTYRLPQVFHGGKHVGGAEEIKRLDDGGKLKERLERVAERNYPSPCDDCWDTRVVSCPKGKCRECNANGFARCPTCCFWVGR